MADLYSKSKLKEAASVFENIDLSSQITIIQQIYDDFKAKSTEAETQYEQVFNDLFFGQLLEYENGKHRIPQATTPIGGKRADLALGFFEDNKYSFDGVKVAVELKGSNISLDQKQHGHGGQTPVDQGFGYKTSFKDCPWLIVSNFASIRLYRDNKQDFQSWTLEQLLDSADNYFHLRSLLGLLKHKYLVGGPGTTPKSEQYLSEFRFQQEQISKAFYKEYSELRIELINDIRYHNPDLDVETLVSKAQKIIDRIIFIHFCEDYGLLPEGKLLEVIQHSQSLINVSIRQILTGFFEAVNKGSAKLGIPSGYNGGLFATDSILNNLKVGDQICQKFVEVGRYDFEDDLSVNILGHIFEQSISDIEQLKIDLLGQEIETEQLVEQKTSKRKKDGIFYTPGYIVDYIVQNSLGKYLNEKEEACLKKHSSKKNGEQLAYQEYQHILQQIKVLDPACGSGAFLVRVFDYLLNENIRVGEKTGTLFDNTAMYKNILQNNIYGVDLNPESVEITKLSLWLKTAEKDKKLNNLDKNIKCGNSLIDDEEIAGESAFDWHKEFPEIFAEGGFDMIVGNPPYVTVKALSKKDKEFYLDSYQVAIGQFDLFVLFYEKGFNLLKNNGYLCYITPSTFISNKDYYFFRKFVLLNTKILELVNLGETVFSDANIDVAILSFMKSNKYNKIKIIKDRYEFDSNIFKNIEQKRFIGNDFSIEINLNENEFDLLDKIYKGKTLLSEILDLPRGIEFGSNSDKIFKDYRAGAHKIIFGKSIDRYCLNFENNFVMYEDNLSVFKPLEIYENEKILIQRIRNLSLKKRIVATYDNEKYLCTNTLRIGYLKTESFNLKFILSILNSNLINFIFLKRFLNKDIYSFQLQQIPIPEVSASQQQPFIEKAEKMLALNAELSEKSDIFLRLLSSKYSLKTLPRKIQKFRELDFADFLKTLKLSKLPLAEQADLMQYFEQNKSTILDIQSQINQTDSEIDKMVFDLYGLSEEERKIVLES